MSGSGPGAGDARVPEPKVGLWAGGAGCIRGFGRRGIGAAASLASEVDGVSNLTDSLGAVGKWGWAGARSAIVNAGTQQVGVWLHLQDKFEWGNVVAAAVGGTLGAMTATGTGWGMGKLGWDLGQFGNGLAIGATAGLVGGFTTAALKAGKLDASQVATDAFGNALGSSIEGTIAPPSAEEQRQQQAPAPQPQAQGPATQPELRDMSTAAPVAVDEQVGQSANGEAAAAPAVVARAEETEPQGPSGTPHKAQGCGHSGVRERGHRSTRRAGASAGFEGAGGTVLSLKRERWLRRSSSCS